MTWFVVLATVLTVVVWAAPRGLRWLIRWRLDGYRREVNRIDFSLPRRLNAPRRVAVVGGGVAGLSAALSLARRGFSVTLFEKNAYLGGKLGSWPETLRDGRTVRVSHGFHAFFPHYWNLFRVLDWLSLRSGFESIGDYVIVTEEPEPIRFRGLDSTPVFNLLSLARAGVFSLREVLRAPGRDLYGLLLEYDGEKTFAAYDRLSFAQFNELAQVPKRLQRAFNTFARAFFADQDKLSFAELIKSFHFYFLGQDLGLVYEYPTRDYQAQFLGPMQNALQAMGATVRLNADVAQLTKTERGFELDGAPFDSVVMAADVVGANRIIANGRGLPPALRNQFAALKPGQRYAVWRIWTDKDLRTELPPFVIVDRRSVLDAMTAYHRLEAESRADFEAHGRFILELHCYAVPDEMDEATLKATFLEEAVHFFPELQGLQVFDEVWQCKRDFTAFHVGQYEQRPTVETGVPGLVCAGDWVKLPFPAMLLECAAASGLAAANVLLREAGLQEEPLVSVPLRGLMAGVPPPPTRKKLLP